MPESRKEARLANFLSAQEKMVTYKTRKVKLEGLSERHCNPLLLSENLVVILGLNSSLIFINMKGSYQNLSELGWQSLCAVSLMGIWYLIGNKGLIPAAPFLFSMLFFSQI